MPAATSSSMMPAPSGRRSSWRIGGGLRMSKTRKSRSESSSVLPVGGNGDERDELAGDFVDDDEAGVFAAGLAGDDGGGGNADER